MFKLAIAVCFENHFGLIHAIFLSLGSTKSGYFFLGHPVDDKLMQRSRFPALIMPMASNFQVFRTGPKTFP